MSSESKQKTQPEPDAPFFGEFGEAGPEDDALAQLPEHRGYDATFDRVYGRKHEPVMEALE